MYKKMASSVAPAAVVKFRSNEQAASSDKASLERR